MMLSGLFSNSEDKRSGIVIVFDIELVIDSVIAILIIIIIIIGLGSTEHSLVQTERILKIWTLLQCFRVISGSLDDL